MVLCVVKIDPQEKGHDLTEDRGGRSAGYAHFRETEQAENQDRVKNNVQNGAEPLGQHGIKVFPVD